MTQAYFCYGAALSSLVNVENTITTPPHILPEYGGAPMPYAGGVARRLMSGRLKRGGRASAALMFDVFADPQAELMTLQRAIMGDLTTQSKSMYVITLDEWGEYTPFLCTVDAPYLQQTKQFSINGYATAARFDLVGGVAQYSTKTSNYSVTTADHLIYCDTTSGNITLSLAAISGFNADVPYRFVKTAAANDLVIDPNSSETINGASTKTITALNASTTIIKSGSAWVTI